MKDLTKVEGTIAHALVVRKDELNKAMSTANERKAKEVFCNILDTSEELKNNNKVEEAKKLVNEAKGSKLWSLIGTYMTGLKC